MKKLMYLGIVMLVLSAWISPVNQGWIVSGRVISEDNGMPIKGVSVLVKGTSERTTTDLNGEYSIKVTGEKAILVFSFVGYVEKSVPVGLNSKVNIELKVKELQLNEVTVTEESQQGVGYGKAAPSKGAMDLSYTGIQYRKQAADMFEHNTESYTTIHENIFHEPGTNPLSTFSIDVDAASYSNLRRFLTSGMTPPKDAVRIEEMINYFDYDYEQPEGDRPFAINTEVGQAPWNEKHYLVHIGLQGKEIATENLPASNLVFLVDVSGSMQSQNKLPLLKKAFNLLIDQLRPKDRVAIVVYAGAAGLVLESTPGSQKQSIVNAVNNLRAGGSTAGGAGIKLAYKVAQENFIEGGNNRIILATDGDFNVGASSDADMERLIEEKRESGVFLTVVGFGMGNYKDSKMEILADKGNGNYAYIDNILEAKKVFVSEFGGTMFTIARDVKIQVEFNPDNVAAYRLIGYENRLLNDEDFNDDRKDAGEIGSGHTVTALYEIIPVGVESEFIKSVDPLKYQLTNRISPGYGDELMTVKIRYKQPEGEKSKLVSTSIRDKTHDQGAVSNNFKWSAAVAGFGMLLRDSEFKGTTTFGIIRELARSARGDDPNGYRAEFIRLIDSGELTARK